MLNIPEEIKALLKIGSTRKNLRVHFPNGEREDITNSNILAESFSFTESVCSENVLRFGLCESSMVEFETFGINNIEGFEIEVSHEIDISSQTEEFIEEHAQYSDDVSYSFYTIKYGVFIVDECMRQSDTRKRRVVAYTKEYQWNKIPNPLEKAKRNGTYLLVKNNPYKYNVFASMYSNVFKDYKENYFVDKTEVNILTDSLYMTTATALSSSLKITDSTGKNETSKYTLTAIGYGQNFRITQDVSTDLYELIYSHVSEDDEILTEMTNTFSEYAQNEEYGFDTEEYERKFPRFKNMVRNVLYNGKPFGSDTTGNKSIALNDYHYIYPYMGYSETELSLLNFIGEVYCTQSISIAMNEYSYDSNDELTTQTIFRKSFQIRPSYSFKANLINNFPDVYITETRNKLKANNKVYYSLTENSNVDFNEVYSSALELDGLFGKYNRYGEFETIKIGNKFGLYPDEDIYPSDELFMIDTGVVLNKTYYKSAWYDNYYTLPYSKVVCNYLDLDTNELSYMEHVIEEVEEGNEDNYQIYDISNNYIVKKCAFSDSQMANVLSVLGENIKNVRYMPSEIELIGLPYIEAGDVIQVVTNDGGFETIILNRTLSGIQRLFDNYESRG